MSGRLAGKVAIVTGAGQGVGRGISLAFANEGANVVVAERNEKTGNAVAKECEAAGARALFVLCDVTERSSIDLVVSSAVEVFGGIDVLVNNAQVSNPAPVPLMEHDDALVDLCFETGYRATLHFMQACYPHLRERQGRIINLGSNAGLDGMKGQAAYGANKEAIRALSKTAAREWGADGINVNIQNTCSRVPDVYLIDARLTCKGHDGDVISKARVTRITFVLLQLLCRSTPAESVVSIRNNIYL